MSEGLETELSKFLKENSLNNIKLSLDAISNYSYVLVQKPNLADESTWGYILNQFREQLNKSDTVQEYEIENICMIVASLQTAKRLTQDLHNNFVRIISQSLP